jgi:hypothetical protein
MIKNIVGVGLAGMILEYYHSSWRVLLVYIAGIVVGSIGRINPVTRVTPLTPLVGSSGILFFNQVFSNQVSELNERKIE